MPAWEFKRYDDAITKVLREFDRHEMPVLSGLDFGHTDPKFLLPIGAKAVVHCDGPQLIITESGVE